MVEELLPASYNESRTALLQIHSDALNFTETPCRPQKSAFPALWQHEEVYRRFVPKDGASKPLPKAQPPLPSSPHDTQAEQSIGEPRAARKFYFEGISLKLTVRNLLCKRRIIFLMLGVVKKGKRTLAGTEERRGGTG